MDEITQNLPEIRMILVPQGAEYHAVCRGLRHCDRPLLRVVAIPIGSHLIQVTGDIWQQYCVDDCVDANHSSASVLVMGLCGSLKSAYPIGTAVLYQHCIQLTNHAATSSAINQGEQTNFQLQTNPDLTNWISSRLSNVIQPVVAVTSDRIVHTVQAKQDLAQTYGADVVDMEGFPLLQAFQQQGVAVAMLRVVSDDCCHDLPDLNAAIDSTGTLQPIPMALSMIRHPVASMRLIRGSLRALKILQATVSNLFTA